MLDVLLLVVCIGACNGRNYRVKWGTLTLTRFGDLSGCRGQTAYGFDIHQLLLEARDRIERRHACVSGGGLPRDRIRIYTTVGT